MSVTEFPPGEPLADQLRRAAFLELQETIVAICTAIELLHRPGSRAWREASLREQFPVRNATIDATVEAIVGAHYSGLFIEPMKRAWEIPTWMVAAFYVRGL